MFCQKCGAELKPRAVFCTKCGSKAPVLTDFGHVLAGAVSATSVMTSAGADVSNSAMTENDKLTNAVISFQNGDVGAFDTIYNESKKYIYYTILKSTGDKEATDDILQETYLGVYKSLGQLQKPGAFKGWAAKIAQHKVSRYYQKKNPELFSLEDDMEEAVGELTEDDMSTLPEDAMINKEVQRLISEIVDELPENQKSAIVSFFYNQMSIAEIAESMGIPENTVKTYLLRGKKKIKEGVLDIEKKHGTKLYSLPIAGLLGLIFTEEAKAAVVTTTATQILGTVTSASGVAAATAATTAKAVGVGSNTVTGAVTSNFSSASMKTATTKRVLSSIGTSAADSIVRSSIRTIIVSAAAGIVVGASASAIITKQIDSKIYETGIGSEDESPTKKKKIRSYEGEWVYYYKANGSFPINLSIDEDKTYIMRANDEVLFSGSWAGDDSIINFDVGLNQQLNGRDLKGVYDKDSDSLVVTRTIEAGPSTDVLDMDFERVD